jgi:lipopolysaccharide/colanic/teichoic acid biosynthesis glycosyltransferase
VRQPLRCLSLEQALELPTPVVLALAPSLEQNPQHRRLLEQLEERDPRETSLTTPLNLLERQLERLPPDLLPEPWLNYQELPWNRLFSLERQLKRVADLLVAAGLLTLTSPLLLVAALLIWLEDRGPVFYVQQRSGWLGRSFQVLKLRTMQVAPADAPPAWTVPGDRRITRVGLWLRRLRLDELPQLLNVLSGDMSLIGPRPERPEFEQELEARIPHYRKRHWMRPGLSGWAQVCAPYAASVEDSELKLSYDLYYLKHFSTWLDLIILFRTIKTVLKAGGR